MRHIMSDLCLMAKKAHRGEIVEAAVRQSGKAISELAKEIKYSRQHIYQFFENPSLNWDIIIAIGKSIKHDFRQDFPQMFIASDHSPSGAQEPKVPYSKQSKLLKECMEEKNNYKQKYYDLLEEHNQLLKQKMPKK